MSNQNGRPYIQINHDITVKYRQQDKDSSYDVGATGLSATKHNLRIVYYIIGWPIDPDVPALYFDIYDTVALSDADSTKPITDINFIYRALVPVDYQDIVHNGLGTWGSLTQVEHPLFGHPCFYLHPCNTRNFLDMLANDSPTMPLIQVVQLWIHSFGPIVGLDLTSESQCLKPG